MKTFTLYMLSVCWCCCWFLGCGGSASTDVTVTQTQNVNQDDANPCIECRGTLAQVEACLAAEGMVPEDCEGEEEEDE